MILCATLAGLWLLLQRTKTDTRWRQFQKVWFGRRRADPPTLFNAPWEPVPICRKLYSRLANIVNRPEFTVETLKLTQRQLML